MAQRWSWNEFKICKRRFKLHLRMDSFICLIKILFFPRTYCNSSQNSNILGTKQLPTKFRDAADSLRPDCPHRFSSLHIHMSKNKKKLTKIASWRHKRIIRNCRIQLDTCASSIQATWMVKWVIFIFKKLLKVVDRVPLYQKKDELSAGHTLVNQIIPFLVTFWIILADSWIFADSTEGKKGYFQGIHDKISQK